MIKSINSKSSKDATFTWSPSVQSDLFSYLKPQQQAILKPYHPLTTRQPKSVGTIIKQIFPTLSLTSHL